MKYVLDASLTKNIEEFTIKSVGVPSLVLMERAALFVFNEVLKLNPKNVICFCGTGNNGADGIAVSRMLEQKGVNTSVVMVGDLTKSSIENITQRAIYSKLGKELFFDDDICEYDINNYDVVVDALFGIGLSRNITSPFSDIIDFINSSNGKIVSIDIPSGLSSDSGKILGKAVKADITCTFGYYKNGHFLNDGINYCGKLKLSDIGLFDNNDLINNHSCSMLIEKEDISDLLPVRNPAGNKSTFGKTLVIAGSETMPGASYLSSYAAFRAGGGMVKLLTDNGAKDVIIKALPEVMITTYNGFQENVLNDCMDFADVCIIGPGMSVNDTSRSIVNYVISNFDGILIIDADGLNILSENIKILEIRKEHGFKTILTPHPGEMKRLFNCKDKEYQDVNYCKEIAMKHNIILVAKDARTIITDGVRTYINNSGSDAIATAGSGDVLAGIISAFCIYDYNPVLHIALAVFLHGLAGVEAAKELTNFGVKASDIIEYFVKVMGRYVR